MKPSGDASVSSVSSEVTTSPGIEGGGGGGGGGGDGGDGGGCGGGEGGGASCAQTSHSPARMLLIEDHVKEALPSNTLLGPIVPRYVAPFTISFSHILVLKAVALKR